MIDFLLSKRKQLIPEIPGSSEIAREYNAQDDRSRSDDVERFNKNNSFKTVTLIQYSVKCLSLIAREKEISQGAFFSIEEKENKPYLRFISGFASPCAEGMPDMLEIGEGFPGQVAKDGRLINISDIPEDYFMIKSGLGQGRPVSIIIFPVKHEDRIIAVIELSSFHRFTDDDERYFSGISGSIAEQIIKCKKDSQITHVTE